MDGFMQKLYNNKNHNFSYENKIYEVGICFLFCTFCKVFKVKSLENYSKGI